MRGAAVRSLQERLVALGYFLSFVDGVFGESTEHAVVAFQKVNGLARDGVVGPRTRRALERPIRPLPGHVGARSHVEVDLTRQVVYLVEAGRITTIFDSSTGSGHLYEDGGEVHMARTPEGSFRVERIIDGWRESSLGLLWRPAYIYGGYALHGSTSVPPYPASHGCVRLTIAAMDRLFPRVAIGTRVYVYRT
jgi:Putative peptidoglycan binding domain/L,D-transpeptidase catalytic domain